MQMLIAAKEAGGNPKNAQAQQALEENVDGTKECLTELIQTIEEAASSAGHVSSLIDSIAKSIARAEERCPARDGASFVDYQTDIVRLVKQIARTSQDMVRIVIDPYPTLR
jgi:talin